MMCMCVPMTTRVQGRDSSGVPVGVPNWLSRVVEVGVQKLEQFTFGRLDCSQPYCLPNTDTL